MQLWIYHCWLVVTNLLREMVVLKGQREMLLPHLFTETIVYPKSYYLKASVS